MKKFFAIFAIAVLAASCAGHQQPKAAEETVATDSVEVAATDTTAAVVADTTAVVAQ
ncbi:MAG: hypothetical protein QM786_16145 [Breznakibacter sp.]